MALSLVFLGVLILTSCGNDATTGPGLFDVYGRIAFRPFETGQSLAEFYIFHNGEVVTDAIITVRSDTIPQIQGQAGHYFRSMNFRIGDTLSYSISSQFGVENGSVTIPDTIEIIRPLASEVIFSGVNYSALWHKVDFVDGYYAYFQHQNGYAAEVRELQIDTTAQFLGSNIINIGVDTFWVETLRGSFFAEVAPNGIIMPRGIVGAAGSFRNVDISIAPPLPEGKR